MYPSLVAMLNWRSMLWRTTVIFHVMHVYISTFWVQTSTNQYVLGMYSDCSVMNRLMQRIAWVVYAWTSTFWSQAGLSLFTILMPCWPCQIHRHLCHSGYSTFTGLLIQFCVGCPPSWLSGSGRTCRMCWVFLISESEGWTWHWLDSCRAQPYPSWTCCGLCFDYIWLCGMGVSAVQGCDACKMLSL